MVIIIHWQNLSKKFIPFVNLIMKIDITIDAANGVGAPKIQIIRKIFT